MKLKSLLLRYYPPGTEFPRVAPGFAAWDGLERRRGRELGEGHGGPASVTQRDRKPELCSPGLLFFHTLTAVPQSPLSDSLRKLLNFLLKSFLVTHESESGWGGVWKGNE